jgi:AP-4 complex subunit epsilon-1
MIGSLKVLVKQSDTSADDASVDSARGAGTAALRLREGEDESCLWQMRCDDEALGMQIKARLSDE